MDKLAELYVRKLACVKAINEASSTLNELDGEIQQMLDCTNTDEGLGPIKPNGTYYTLDCTFSPVPVKAEPSVPEDVIASGNYFSNECSADYYGSIFKFILGFVRSGEYAVSTLPINMLAVPTMNLVTVHDSAYVIELDENNDTFSVVPATKATTCIFGMSFINEDAATAVLTKYKRDFEHMREVYIHMPYNYDE
ncbi:hypothetical protein HNP86_001848 [Methanococcus maripaludis]|uniref:Uncharacterized protein n=1 Tax=Methanococcus maripaludis TaxID=39152 RepID=A0A7J9NVI6_METMI|nr:hypothetical protein [Methanococcus maripaludis]MBA2851689.1 hypothetical protein [Methanococcus maripaludis]